MKNKTYYHSLSGLLLLTIFMASCSKTEMTPSGLQSATEARLADNTNGYLYTMSNDSVNNQILVFSLDNTGHPQQVSTIDAHGAGSGIPLGSQGGITIDGQNKMLYAVNAGSNTVASFRIQSDGNLIWAYTA